MKKVLISMALGALLIAGMPAVGAASQAFDAGVKSYGAHRYNDAINQLGAAERQSPSDPLIHYYLGLSYQGENQMSLARQEFAWVAQNAGGALRTQANTAIRNLSRYANSYESPASAAAAPAITAAGFRMARTPAPTIKVEGRLKVLEFRTSWCHFCKQFEPIWEQTSSRLSNKADFRQLDAEDPGNSNLVSRYSIRGYPTLVFTDSTGNALQTQVGAFADAGSFESAIGRFSQ